MLEVELKVRVAALEPVRRRLEKRKAEFLSRVHEHDIYYNAPHRDFGITDEAVRVRYIGDHAVLTYKGAKRAMSALKAREELNTGVESGEVFEAILDRLGFTRTAGVNKWRESYRIGTALISLDAVDGLGTFVEIEIQADDDGIAAAEEIRRIAEEIGAEGEPILASYLEMVLATRPAVQS